jgi:hypothetical protein
MNRPLGRGITTINESTPRQPIPDWTTLKGHDVDIYDHGQIADRGRVEAVTADGSIFWLAQEGANARRLVQNGLSVDVRLRDSD